jgi:predicted metalloprotease with PDZ domain
MTPPVRYRIACADPAGHLYEVSCTLVDPDPAGQSFRMPAWIPGSYLIREFARHVVSFTAASGGAPVAVAKTAKDTWRCAPCAGPLTVTYTVYAWDPSVRAAHLDPTHSYFNGPSVFVAALGREQRPCEVELVRPAGERYRGWRVATALPELAAPPYGFGSYRAADYDELCDHPVECGDFALATFEACGVQHDVAITGRQRCDLERLVADLRRVCEWQIRLFGEPPPFHRYLFLVTVAGEGYGGLEHRASASLLCARDDLPVRGESAIGERYRRFLGLASHEYFHTWNVKRIKPEAFLPYDLAREVYTRQLWAFEGITSYYDDLALVRCGLIRPEEYLKGLGETLTRVLRGSGRLKQSLADSSFDAWIKFYRQDENAPNAIVSYYAKGALAALAFDLAMRAASGGQRSLDDLMRVLWRDYGQRGRGVPEGAIERLVVELGGESLVALVQSALHGTGDLPLAELLEPFGVRLALRAADGDGDQGGDAGRAGQGDGSARRPRAVLGAKAAGDGRLQHVYDGGAARAAGLSAGDQIVAIDGLKPAAGVEAAIARHAPGERVEVHAFRRDELMRFEVTLDAAPLDTAWLAIDDTADAGCAARRAAWLGTESG